MAIPELRDIFNFIKRNDRLIKDINDTGEEVAEDIRKLADRLDKAREDTQTLLDRIQDPTRFKIAREKDTQLKQQNLLEEIEKINKEIQVFKEDEEFVTFLLGIQGMLFKRMANTFNDTIGRVITFSPADLERLDVVMERAIMDTEQKKKLSLVLDGAVSIAKIMFQIAKKVVVA